MKAKLQSLFILLALLAGINHATAQATRYFRIAGPTATTITAFRPDGTLVWSNAQPGATYTIQTAKLLPAGTNWTDYVQITNSNGASTNVLVDFNTPGGMAFIPGGVFTMGDNLDGYVNAIPTNATVSAFYMDANLVTYSQWQFVLSWATNNGYGFNNIGAGKAPDQPVYSVDWYDAIKWCNARSQQAGLTPVYYTDTTFTHPLINFEPGLFYVNWSANGYRLPTEAEWEKAARGGPAGQRFPWGNIISENLADYFGDPPGYAYDLGPLAFNPALTNGTVAPYTSPASYYAPNSYGLYDMAGNLQEWCWDWYTTAGYAGGTDPHGAASGVYRVFRGGFWNGYPLLARCSHRNYGVSSNTGNQDIGFRCVRIR